MGKRIRIVVRVGIGDGTDVEIRLLGKTRIRSEDCK